jgi:hypothetical protein
MANKIGNTFPVSKLDRQFTPLREIANRPVVVSSVRFNDKYNQFQNKQTEQVIMNLTTLDTNEELMASCEGWIILEQMKHSPMPVEGMFIQNKERRNRWEFVDYDQEQIGEVPF